MQRAGFLAVAAVAALVGVAGCGGGGGGGGTTSPGVFTSLSVTPTTVSVVVQGTQNLTVAAKDQNGATMSGLTTTYQSNDPSVATVTSAGVVTGVAVGTTTIAVNGTVGSTTKSQTVNVTVSTASSSASVNATTGLQFEPASVTITAGGTVTWNFAGTAHNVTFDGAAPQGGNVPTTANSSVSRTFATAGTYAYHCTIHSGMNGTITVQ
jgi:plastocyanin